MTIMELDTIASTHGLWNFEVSFGRRAHEGIVLRRNVGSVITIVVKIDRYSHEITSRGMYVHVDSNSEPEWYDLTEEQFKELAFFVN